MRGYKITFKDGSIKFLAAYAVDKKNDYILSIEKNNEQFVYCDVLTIEEVECNG